MGETRQQTLDGWLNLSTHTKKRKWWEESDEGNNSNKKRKWTTLEYQGPAFPPPFSPLPPPVTLRYEGQPIKLKQKTEECVVSYIKERGKAKNLQVFNQNFWEDWIEVMEPEEKKQIRSLKGCDFTIIENYLKKIKYFETQRKEIKHLRNKRRTCMIDGYKEEIQNPMVEPPGVFVGKGNHPRNGRIKPRIDPEMVTVNCSEGTVCRPPAGHTFNEIQHDNEVLWLAFWEVKRLGKRKYIRLSASSSQKARLDKRKFDIAREMHRDIPRLLKLCQSPDQSSIDKPLVQKYIALFLMIRGALRPGYPKKPGLSADTRGLCSLTFSNLKLSKKEKSCWLSLDFLGKSSTQNTTEIVLPESISQKLEELQTDKEMEDQIFDKVKAPTLNRFFKKICRYPESMRPTLKTLRTYNAGILFENKLEEIKKEDKSKMMDNYRNALQEVSNMLNHKGENTAKLYYLDPRITVAWCLKWNIPIEDVFTRVQRKKFEWAIEMKDREFKFVS